MWKLFVWTAALAFVGARNTFHEELALKQLDHGKVLAHVQLTNKIALSRPIEEWEGRSAINEIETHFGLFPRSIGQLVQQVGLAELHFSLTHGRPSSQHFISNSPSGATLWAWISKRQEFHFASTSVDSAWRKLVNIVSGQFCSSTNLMVESLTASPKYSLRPEGSFDSSDYELRFSVLPREAACTENITPWLKILPCRNHAGFAALLSPLSIYDTDYHSLGTHILVTKNGDDAFLELVQTLELVFNPLRTSGSSEWTLESLFHKPFESKCHLATDSTVYVYVNGAGSAAGLQPSQWKKQGDWNIAVYNNAEGALTRLTLDFSQIGSFKENAPRSTETLRVDRYLTGAGQEFGTLVTVLDNSGSPTPISLAYLDVLPWFIRIYGSTAEMLEICPGKPTVTRRLSDLQVWSYIPAVDRQRPATIEAQLTIPGRCMLLVQMDFERAYLKYTEFPYDPNRGLDIPSLFLTIERKSGQFICQKGLQWSPKAHGSSSSVPMRITTPTLLLTMPLPDFTMPYNVITLTCTMIALFYGSMFNLFYRRYYPASEKQSLKDRILGLFKRKPKTE